MATFAVYQLRERQLWREIDAAYTWWCDTGRPAPSDCRLHVSPDGAHTVVLTAHGGEYHWPLAGFRGMS